MKKTSFFEIERYRSRLAVEKKYAKLRNLYSNDYPELINRNTGRLWDELNIEHKTGNSFSPMEYDKLNYARRFIVGKNNSVLNVGFGSANFEKIFFSNTSEIISWYGIDISKKSVDAAKKLFPRANFKVGSVENLQFKNETFDYVLAFEVLEHIQPSHILVVLKELKRVLKKGGKLLLSVPINEGLEEMLKNNYNPNAHLRDYTVELIIAELVIAGFIIKHKRTFYAFSKYYKLKSILTRLIPKIKQINGVFIVAQKL